MVPSSLHGALGVLCVRQPEVCDRHGIYAASRAPGHGSVAVTAAHYLDKKSRVTRGLGAAFSDRIVEFKQAQTGSA